VQAAQRDWALETLAMRAQCLGNLARTLHARSEELAVLASREVGKPIRESRAELEKCAWVCEYYALHGPAQLDDVPVETERWRSYYSHRPLGVLLAIM